jgi:hypothetical protein
LEFLRALEQHRVSAHTRTLFERLASRPPALRLAVNIRSLMGETVVRDVENILAEGLDPEERRALMEIDAKGLPIALREIAHGLLSVHERWLAWKALSRPIREARERAGHWVERKLLDGVLGDDQE